MALLRDKKGKFVRTTPDYKAMYEEEVCKYAQASKANRELNACISKQSTTISELNARLTIRCAEIKNLRATIEQMSRHMGWWKRLTWSRKMRD